ncbi:hypothetical protein AUR64_04070 [Haloprofundus marisrubri]|uniref:Uncharacterized protein n=1 Tax=Haloprofundus marisrubri TaxID=1514971 RepID=A0A0W1RDB7_9EURY|nr:hypothetical protein AUR64_04070 [Haloprofundus marisrubri]
MVPIQQRVSNWFETSQISSLRETTTVPHRRQSNMHTILLPVLDYNMRQRNSTVRSFSGSVSYQTAAP